MYVVCVSHGTKVKWAQYPKQQQGSIWYVIFLILFISCWICWMKLLMLTCSDFTSDNKFSQEVWNIFQDWLMEIKFLAIHWKLNLVHILKNEKCLLNMKSIERNGFVETCRLCYDWSLTTHTMVAYWWFICRPMNIRAS